MLGELLGEDIGQITNIRVLPPEGGVPCVEVTFQADGTLLGIHTHDLGTYTSTPRPDGTFFGQGQGILTTEDGQVASWVGQGVGKVVRPGAYSYRGAIYCSTASPALARLNECALLFEFDSDESGKTSSKTYEWK